MSINNPPMQRPRGGASLTTPSRFYECSSRLRATFAAPAGRTDAQTARHGRHRWAPAAQPQDFRLQGSYPCVDTMLTVYCDDSGTDKRNRVAVVAGYAARLPY